MRFINKLIADVLIDHPSTSTEDCFMICLRQLKRCTPLLLLTLTTACLRAENSAISTQKVDIKLKKAFVAIEGDELVANTGLVERRWKWGANGLVTTSLKHLEAKKEWAGKTDSMDCDWSYTGYMAPGTAVLKSIKARLSSDEGFTSQHIELTTEVFYDQVAVQHIVWIYPSASGFRTQLKIKKLKDLNVKGRAVYDVTAPKDALHNITSDSKELTGITDTVPINTLPLKKRAVGYYAGTQARNKRETPLLLDTLINEDRVKWNSILSLEGSDGGLILVKESNKTVNQAGNNTGIYKISDHSVASTGWGIAPQELTNRYRGLWANWLIVHNKTTPEERELELKEFDRHRYPVDPARDIYIMANTWGTGESKDWSQSAAREENVLKEIASQSDLGIDVQQIDDGWQGWDTGGKHWRPVPVLDYSKRPLRKKKGMGDGETYDKNAKAYTMYPEGWKNVKKEAKEKGVRLGLWCNSNVPLEDLKWNFTAGDFRSYKLDFIYLRNFNQVEQLMDKVRDFVLFTDQKVRINWDVTENWPRTGYFFAREYGNIYLANRKTKAPAGVVYVPYLMLRDAWHLAKYTNLNKFQVTIQNGDRCNQKVSDAFKHRHDYLFAQTMMACPLFFQETHYYSDEARDQLRPIIKIYKEQRDEMYQGYVFPIGDEPDNKSWSGFQNYNPETKTGFLTVLRQIENREKQKGIALKFLSGKTIKITNLVSRTSRVVNVPDSGIVPFAIEKPADYLFLKYERMN